MALSELQWGRILALAWLDNDFKEIFETHPAQAFEDLKKKKAELPPFLAPRFSYFASRRTDP